MPPGSGFSEVDWHVHTPASRCFQEEGIVLDMIVRQAIALAGDVSGDLLDVERCLDRCIVDTCGFSATEVAVVERTLLPRDPLVVSEDRVH